MITYHYPEGPHKYFSPLIISVWVPGFAQAGLPPLPPSSARARMFVPAPGMTVWVIGHPSVYLHSMSFWAQGFAQSGPPAPPASVAQSRHSFFNLGASIWVSGHPTMAVHSLGMVIWTVSAGVSGPVAGSNVFEGLRRHTGRLMR